MSVVNRFSSQVIDYAERLSDIADAVEGKKRHSTGRAARWLVLPAAGAGLYAFVKSDFFSRQAKEVLGEARSRASELPDDLMARVHQASKTSSSSRNGSSRSSSSRRSTRKASKRRTSTAGR